MGWVAASACVTWVWNVMVPREFAARSKTIPKGLGLRWGATATHRQAPLAIPR